MFGRSGITVAVKVEKEDDGKTPATKRAGEYVTLKVQDTDGRAVCRTMRRTDQLQGLMDFYYDSAHGRVQRGTGRFLYDGRRLRGWQTPAELEMEDGDEVDFFEELIGGAAGSGWARPSSMLAEADSPSRELEPSMLITLRVKDSEGVRITRTMHRTDELRDLISFYEAMVPDAVVDGGAAKGYFMYYGRRVGRDQTPENYDMEDGDEVSFFPDRIRSLPVTLSVKDRKGRSITRTMRRFDALDVLFDLYFAMLPSSAPKEGFFMFRGSEIDGSSSPANCDMENGDEISFSPFIQPSIFVTLTMKGKGNNDRWLRRHPHHAQDRQIARPD
uniref:Ubiquitin-like domain-containing protein n=1 Tax=Oryza punctata TaxID=4537 RepID=A0A0E0LMI7_ORYPU